MPELNLVAKVLSVQYTLAEIDDMGSLSDCLLTIRVSVPAAEPLSRRRDKTELPVLTIHRKAVFEIPHLRIRDTVELKPVSVYGYRKLG